MNETRRIRLPATKRGLVSSNYHTFIASDEDTGQPIGVATWLVPNSDNARHHLRKLSLYERIAGLAFQLHDALISAVIPRKLYALFYPEDAARLQRQVRWQAEMDRSTKPYIQASHERVGYWYLSFLCEPAAADSIIRYLIELSPQACFPSTPDGAWVRRCFSGVSIRQTKRTAQYTSRLVPLAQACTEELASRPSLPIASSKAKKAGQYLYARCLDRQKASASKKKNDTARMAICKGTSRAVSCGSPKAVSANATQPRAIPMVGQPET